MKRPNFLRQRTSELLASALLGAWTAGLGAPAGHAQEAGDAAAACQKLATRALGELYPAISGVR